MFVMETEPITPSIKGYTEQSMIRPQQADKGMLNKRIFKESMDK
jgi:hypothetical protein